MDLSQGHNRADEPSTDAVNVDGGQTPTGTEQALLGTEQLLEEDPSAEPSEVVGSDAPEAVATAAEAATTDVLQEDTSSEAYSFDLVNDLIQTSNWIDLEKYFVRYLPVSSSGNVIIVHAGLMVHSRLGQLINLKNSGGSGDDVNRFFNEKILPLRASESKYANPSKLNAQVDQIQDLIANNIFKHGFKTMSAFWRFMVKNEIYGATFLRCLLCQEIVEFKKNKSIKVTFQEHMRTCTGLTRSAKDILSLVEAQDKQSRSRTSEESMTSGGLGQVSKKARVADHIANIKKDATTSVELMEQVGTIYLSEETDHKMFEELVRCIADLLFDITRSAVAALMGKGLQDSVTTPVYIHHLDDIKRDSSSALSKLNDLRAAYYSGDKDITKFTAFADFLFKIHNCSSLISISRTVSSTSGIPASASVQLPIHGETSQVPSMIDRLMSPASTRLITNQQHQQLSPTISLAPGVPGPASGQQSTLGGTYHAPSETEVGFEYQQSHTNTATAGVVMPQMPFGTAGSSNQLHQHVLSGAPALTVQGTPFVDQETLCLRLDSDLDNVPAATNQNLPNSNVPAASNQVPPNSSMPTVDVEECFRDG